MLCVDAATTSRCRDNGDSCRSIAVNLLDATVTRNPTAPRRVPARCAVVSKRRRTGRFRTRPRRRGAQVLEPRRRSLSCCTGTVVPLRAGSARCRHAEACKRTATGAERNGELAAWTQLRRSCRTVSSEPSTLRRALRGLRTPYVGTLTFSWRCSREWGRLAPCGRRLSLLPRTLQRQRLATMTQGRRTSTTRCATLTIGCVALRICGQRARTTLDVE